MGREVCIRNIVCMYIYIYIDIDIDVSVCIYIYMHTHILFMISGGFHEWGTPHSWMVYYGKSQLEVDDDWGYPYFRKPPHGFQPKWHTQRKCATKLELEPQRTAHWGSESFIDRTFD